MFRAEVVSDLSLNEEKEAYQSLRLIYPDDCRPLCSRYSVTLTGQLYSKLK